MHRRRRRRSPPFDDDDGDDQPPSALDHVDAMRPIKQAGVVSTHSLLFFAPRRRHWPSAASLHAPPRHPRGVPLRLRLHADVQLPLRCGGASYGTVLRRRFVSVCRAVPVLDGDLLLRHAAQRVVHAGHRLRAPAGTSSPPATTSSTTCSSSCSSTCCSRRCSCPRAADRRPPRRPAGGEPRSPGAARLPDALAGLPALACRGSGPPAR